jgi:predicted ribosomally synthesized peptide with SipW-like signal peptide
MFKRIMTMAAGAIAALAIGAAGAYFTAQIQVPDNVIKAGTVAISAEPTSAAISIDALAPGTSQIRSLAVLNNGNLPCDVIVTPAKKAGTTALYSALTCTVTCGTAELYRGSVASMTTAPLRMAPGARGDVRFELGLPAEVQNDLAGDYVKLSLYVDAEQAR